MPEENLEKTEQALESFLTKSDVEDDVKQAILHEQAQEQLDLAEEQYQKAMEEADEADRKVQEAQKAFENLGCCAKLFNSKAKQEIKAAEDNAESKQNKLKEVEEELQRLKAESAVAQTTHSETLIMGVGSEDITKPENSQ